MSTERIDVVEAPAIDVATEGLTVVLTVDPTRMDGEPVSTHLFPEEAKALRKALKRAIRAAQNTD